MRIHWFLLFSIFCIQKMNAQGLLGVRTERWSGMSAAPLNPAITNVFPQKWELQITGLHLYGASNYLFLKNTSLKDILQHPEDIRAVSDTLGLAELPESPIFFDFPVDRRKWYGVLDSRVDGPAFSLRFGDRHTVGIFSAFRTLVSGYRIPRSLGYTYLDKVPWGVGQSAGQFSINGMAWGEVGAHYAYRSPDLGGNMWGLGVNVKSLHVLQAGYAKTIDPFTYIRNSADTMSLTTGNWDIAYNTDLANNLQTSTNQEVQSNGRGFSLDLGFNYIIPDLSADQPEDYILHFGASLTDIGYANIKKNAEAHRFRFNDTIVLGLSDLNQVKTADEVVKKLSQIYLGDSTASLSGNSFTLLTPTRLNVHADYRIAPYIYVNALWQQRIAPNQNTLKAPSVLAITPRFESRWFSAFAPVSMIDYRRAQLGAAVRLGVLTIGTDHLPSLLKQKRWTGTDMYLLLKVNGFSLKKRDRGLSRKDRTWGKVGCDTM
jgi:Family of unknown function (DUF5723)